jgi:hypothetical protein
VVRHFLPVEGHTHDGGATVVVDEEVVDHAEGRRARNIQDSRAARAQRGDAYAGTGAGHAAVENGLVVLQYDGSALRGFARRGVQRHERLRRAAGGRHQHQRSGAVPDDNDVAGPRHTAEPWHLAHAHRRAAFHADAVDHSPFVEGDVPPIGREGKAADVNRPL